MSSSPSDPAVAALRDAWRQARDALRFTSVRGREVTVTHHLRIGHYSAVDSALPRGKCVGSEPFRAGGHRWELCYYPNGHANSKSGGASVSLRLLDNRFLGTAADATAAYKVAILDGQGNVACADDDVTPSDYSVRRRRGTSAIWSDVAKDKADMLRRCLEDDGLSVRCDVTVFSVEKESRVKCFLRDWLQQ